MWRQLTDSKSVKNDFLNVLSLNKITKLYANYLP